MSWNRWFAVSRLSKLLVFVNDPSFHYAGVSNYNT